MSKVKDIQSKTFGSIAAIQTLVENYPSLKNTDSIMESIDIGTSLGYMLSLLRVIGLTQTDIYNWLSKILCGEAIWTDDMKETLTASSEKATGGILNAIEYAIKGILFANIKDLFGGCPVEPMIPDWLIEESSVNIDGESGKGLKVNIAMIDTFGTLQNCPCDDFGSIFYFDTKPNIYNLDYNVNTVYKSSDFNAFLWYIINKSGADGKLWDNRVNVQSDLLASVVNIGTDDNPIYTWPLSEAFFDSSVQDGKITDGNKTITKKSIMCCRYIDSGNITDGDGIIKVTLPENRYRYKSKNGSFYINRTIFEFNYDYIFSLKLFDTKTLVANIINSMLSLSSTIGVGVTFEKNIVKQQVSEMVKNIMTAQSDEDIEQQPCVNTFTNEQFDNAMKRAEMAKNGEFDLDGTLVNVNEVDTGLIVDKIKKISQSEDQQGAINDALTSISDTISNAPEISVDMKFACDVSFIYNFLQQTVTEIVMQILSPKVTMLYAINSAIMGDISDIKGWEQNFTFHSINDLLSKLRNLIENIIKQCLELILKELFNFLMEKLGPIIKIFTMRLLLETVRDYKDLILQLITNCGMLPLNIARYADGTLNIDDVRYADIVPMQTAPGNNNC